MLARDEIHDAVAVLARLISAVESGALAGTGIQLASMNGARAALQEGLRTTPDDSGVCGHSPSA